MNNIVRSYVSDIRMKLGNVSEAQMPLHILLSRLYSVIDKRIVELNISTQNWVLSSYQFNFNGGDTYSLAGADSFGTPVLVEIADTNGIFVPIEIINRTNIRLAQEGEKAAAAFDTIDGELKIHFTMPCSFGTVRVWYEPDIPMPRNLDANIPLKNLFRNYVTSEVALLCLAYVMYPSNINSDTYKEQIKESLMAEIVGLPPDYEGGWRQAWELEITRAKIQGRAIKIPFRAGY